jgi:hypothetical protein
MSTNPDFDFQLGRSVRLRGWGFQGIAALVLVLSAAVVLLTEDGPVRPALQWVISHLTVAPKIAL